MGISSDGDWGDRENGRKKEKYKKKEGVGSESDTRMANGSDLHLSEYENLEKTFRSAAFIFKQAYLNISNKLKLEVLSQRD